MGIKGLLRWLGKGVDVANGRYQRHVQSRRRAVHLFGCISVGQISQAAVGQAQRDRGALRWVINQAQPSLFASML